MSEVQLSALVGIQDDANLWQPTPEDQDLRELRQAIFDIREQITNGGINENTEQRQVPGLRVKRVEEHAYESLDRSGKAQD